MIYTIEPRCGGIEFSFKVDVHSMSELHSVIERHFWLGYTIVRVFDDKTFRLVGTFKRRG